ncbi:ArnT family glycosyltransferase [Cohnella hashimotonis]|uniref:Glycosyltransferase family 39 protein n=1 Tax=Cohnella hashimotonis TaxID=2826895 RepID=A0ABT6TI45_9BACL|nr:glycosyltransferase family 39 protein [Cohnella hashimotonis]MDI4646000.1 glycosyltransferase family 39 protein [Cohnella hashimotonis]
MYGARLFLTIGSLFMAVVFVSSFVFTVDAYGSFGQTLASTVCCALVALLIAHVLNRRPGSKTFLVLFIVIGMGLRIGWIFLNDAPPRSDFLFMYNAAQEAAAGSFGFADSAYFTSFPYQFGFTMYEAAIIRLFGDSLLALKVIGAIFNMGTAVILYFTGARLFNETCGRIASCFYAFYLPNILMCSVLTNQHLSVFLFFLGCSLMLKRRGSLLSWLWAGLAIGLGQLIRPIGVVYLSGIVLFALLEVWKKLREGRRRKAWRQAGMLLAMIGIYAVIQWAASTSLQNAGVTQQALSDGDKYWKFMVGLNAKTNGGWNIEDAQYANSFAFGEERHEAELLRIKERLENKTEVLFLMGRKLALMWGSGDSSAYWSLDGTGRYQLERSLSMAERPQYVVFCGFALFALLALWRAGMYRGPLLYILLLLIYAGAHLAIEIQTRYRLDLMPAFMLLASYGVWQTYNSIRRAASSLDETTKDAAGGIGI